jgi:diacylglycerol kinase family enzyme
VSTSHASRSTRLDAGTIPFGLPYVIADPAANRRGLTELRSALAELGVVVDADVARRPGDARELAEAAVARGTRLLVAAGGNQLAHELVRLLVDPTAPAVGEPDAGPSARRLAAEAADDPGDDPGEEAEADPAAAAVPGAGARSGGPILGLVGFGRQDLAATFGLPEDPAEAARNLLGGNLFLCDVGRARWRGPDGTERTSVFANAAELGYPARVSAGLTALAWSTPGAVGRVRRFGASVAALARSRSTPARLEVAHTAVELRLAGLVVANGQFSMGGMKLAPRALPDDGRLSVIAFEGDPVDIYGSTGRLYFGDHVPSPKVREYQSPRVTVDSAERLPLALDGIRAPGGPPVTFDVLPGALRVKV